MSKCRKATADLTLKRTISRTMREVCCLTEQLYLVNHPPVVWSLPETAASMPGLHTQDSLHTHTNAAAAPTLKGNLCRKEQRNKMKYITCLEPPKTPFADVYFWIRFTLTDWKQIQWKELLLESLVTIVIQTCHNLRCNDKLTSPEALKQRLVWGLVTAQQ